MLSAYPDILSIHNVRSALGIGRTKAYALVRSSQIPSFQIGKSIRIPKRALLEFIQNQSYDKKKADACLNCKGGIQYTQAKI